MTTLYICLLFVVLCPSVHIVMASLSLYEEPDAGAPIFYTASSSESREQTLKCTVTGLSAAQIVSWKKNGEIISKNGMIMQGSEVEATNRYHIITSTGTSQYYLRISDITVNSAAFDTGVYQCIVTDSTGNNILLSSRNSTLTVYVVPEEDQPECGIITDIYDSGDVYNTSGNVFEGIPLNLTCKTYLGVPTTILEWYRNDSNQGLNDQLVYKENNTLALRIYEWSPSRQDVDLTIICTIQHEAFNHPLQNRVKTSCTLGPFDVTYVTIYPVEQTILSENETVSFACNVHGNLDVLVYMLFNGIPVEDIVEMKNVTFNSDNVSVEFNDTETSLTITGLGDADKGIHTITCIAEYGNYNNSESGQLTVRGLPTTVSPTTTTMSTTPTTTLVPTTTSTPTESGNVDVTTANIKLTTMGEIGTNKQMIIIFASGGGVGVLLFIVLFIILCVFCRRKPSDQKPRPPQPIPDPEPPIDFKNGDNVPLNPIDGENEVKTFKGEQYDINPYSSVNDVIIKDERTLGDGVDAGQDGNIGKRDASTNSGYDDSQNNTSETGPAQAELRQIPLYATPLKKTPKTNNAEGLQYADIDLIFSGGSEHTAAPTQRNDDMDKVMYATVDHQKKANMA